MNEFVPGRPGLWWERSLVGLLVIGVAALAFVSSRLDVDYWDAFDYLHNARLIGDATAAAHLSLGYWDVRPPVVPLLMAPAYKLCPAGAAHCSLPFAHLISFAIGATGLFVVYRLLRRAFSRAESLAGAALVLINPLFIHYAPFAMADVPSMTFVGLALWGLLAARERGTLRAFAVAGLLCGAAFATKYPTMLLVGAVGLFELLRALRPTRPEQMGGPHLGRRLARLALDYRPWVALGLSALLFLAIHHLAYRLAPNSIPSTLDRLRGAMRAGLGAGAAASSIDPVWEYAAELRYLVGIPLLVLAGLGALVAVSRWTDDDLLHLIWSVVFLGWMTFKVAHKEARYLLPAVPSLVFLQLRGFELLREILRRAERFLPWIAGRRRYVELALVAALLVQPSLVGAAEGARFADPVYSRPFLSRICDWIRYRIGARGRVVMAGNFGYAMYPRLPVSMPLDEYNHFHHINASAFEYLLDRRIESGGPPPLTAFPEGGAIIQLPPVWFEAPSGPNIAEPPVPIRVTLIDPPGPDGQRSPPHVETREFRFR